MNRAEMLGRAVERREPWDMVIIGGGAVGMGVAVDAASRGYEVLLVEQHDFGKGTSSRSTKLVHGGVRYLEQGAISLVMEALKERGLLRQNAPHLVTRPRLRRPQLRVVGSAVLRRRSQGVRPACGPLRLRTIGDPLEGRDAGAPADDQDRGAARRRRVLRRAVRRCAAADQPGGDGGRAGRPRAELHAGDCVDARRRRLRRRDCRARPRERTRVSRAGARRHQRRRTSERSRASAGASGRRAPHRAQPGHPPRVRWVVSPGRDRDHGAAHDRRPRHVRDPVARPHGGRHDRHANHRRHARAASASTTRSSSSWRRRAATCDDRSRAPTC